MTRRQLWLRRVERVLAIAGLVILLGHAFFHVAVVSTSSMAPLLVGWDKAERPDWILVEKWLTARSAPPRRFQVVGFVDSEGSFVAKRVVGFPGETVQILRDRTLLIDGIPLAFPPSVDGGKGYLPVGNVHDGKTYKVPEGHVYVLGDDTRDSQDSRFTGGVPLARVVGRVLLRAWPPGRVTCL